MYIFCVFVAALGVALGDPSIPTATKAPPPIDRTCISGETSVSCRTRCGLTSWVAYCEGIHCLCRPPRQDSHNELHKEPVDPPTTPTPPSPTDYESDESGEQDRQQVWFFIVNLGRFFGYNRNETANSTAEPDTTSTPLLSSSADVTVDRVDTPNGVLIADSWGFQHYLGFLIVLLLCVLILLEVSSCYRRRKERNNTDNIFKNVPVPNK